MKSKATYLLLLLLSTFSGCKHHEPSHGPTSFFTLTQAKLSTGGRIASHSDVVTEFDLGDVKASREFFFLLGNGGESAITDIHLVTDNPAFVVSPAGISALEGTNSTTTGAVPVVSLGVVHGVQVNGVGFTDILPMNDNSAVLTISGKTIQNGTTVDVTAAFHFTVHAKVMDIQLFDSGNEIDLLSPQLSVGGASEAGGLGSVPGYMVPSQNVSIKNTGNVDITVTTTKLMGYPFPKSSFSLAPNASANLDLVSEVTFTSMISLDGNGTIADHTRLQMGNDGKAYFAVSN